jgi:RNA polymerase sigma-54 factor
MQLGMKIVPKQIQTLKPTLQQLQYYRLLQQTNLELELDMLEEVSQNPALEIEEVRKCPTCGEIILDGQPCSTCMSRKIEDQDREKILTEKIDMMEEIYSSSEGTYEASTYESVPEDELPDSFAMMVRAITLEEHLKNRLAIDCSDLSKEDRILADILIDHIDAGSDIDTHKDFNVEKSAMAQNHVDNPGLIKASDEELAEELGVPLEQLKRVRRRLAEIDPVGSGLESSIEVLALQAELTEELIKDERTALASIIRHHLKDIDKEHYLRVGKLYNIPAKRVKELIEFTSRNFHIHPRRQFEEIETNAEWENPYVTADVRIREIDGKFVVEVQDSGLPVLKINKYYMESYQKLKKDRHAFSAEERKHIKEYFERATTYLENVNSRRRTMLEIAEEIVRNQEDFLRKGPLYLKKLTRKQIAEKIGVHPSTVSRALAVRFCWLPDNSILSFNVFFDPSATYIEMIRQILADETAAHVFSDIEICEKMAEKGHNLSRRVITKYRKKGHIPPSGRRRRILINKLRKEKDLGLSDDEMPLDLLGDEELEDEFEPEEDGIDEEENEKEDEEEDDGSREDDLPEYIEK